MPQLANDTERFALEYVWKESLKDTGCTRVGFIEDFNDVEGLGDKLWLDLNTLGFVQEGRDGKVTLTQNGLSVLQN